jgi:predicted Zn-dependent peptidase
MSRLGKAEISSGEFIDYDAALTLLDAVTVERIQDLAQELAAGDLSLVSVGQADEDALSRILSRG